MGDGFQFFDIVLFAMIAVFLVLRLRGMLGRRTGEERRRDPFRREQPAETAPSDRVVALPTRNGAGANADANAGLTQIALADRGFEPRAFVEGARGAFEIVVRAFAAGEKDKLRGMLSGAVFDNFARAIDQRQARGETLETTLVAIRSAEITAAAMREEQAVVTVRFVSEQINLLRDAAGRVIEGASGQAADVTADVTDVWTFSRATDSRDPNWTLVETQSPG